METGFGSPLLGKEIVFSMTVDDDNTESVGEAKGFGNQ